MPSFCSEYICVVQRHKGCDDRVVRIEIRGPLHAPLTACKALLRNRLGVEVRLAARGSLAAPSQIETRQKPIRLIDSRKAEG